MHSISISSDSWMNRMYEIWASSGGKKPTQPTLCHFFWVVVLWGPVRWFFHKPSYHKASPAEKVGLTLICLAMACAIIVSDPRVLLVWAAALGIMVMFGGIAKLWTSVIGPRVDKKLANAWTWITETRKTRFGISPLYVMIASAVVALIMGSIFSALILKITLGALAFYVIIALLVFVIGVAAYTKDKIQTRRIMSQKQPKVGKNIASSVKQKTSTVKRKTTI